MNDANELRNSIDLLLLKIAQLRAAGVLRLRLGGTEIVLAPQDEALRVQAAPVEPVNVDPVDPLEDPVTFNASRTPGYPALRREDRE